MAELEFITAPHIIPSDNPEEQVGEERTDHDQIVILILTRTSTAGGSQSLVRHLMLTRRLTVISVSRRALT